MKRTVIQTLVAAAFATTALGAHAAISYDQNITGNMIFGSGNSNGGFTVDTANGVEVGLRAKLRYPLPSDNAAGIGSNGDGTYNQPAVGYTSVGAVGGTRAAWNFDWSINTFSSSISAYTYLLELDFDPSFGTNFQSFDLINGAPVFDHSFGNSLTASGGGASAATAVAYDALKANNSLVQNSWNYDFFDGGAFTFDPTANGNYSIFLTVLDGNGGTVARSGIDVIVGTGYVPEPGSLALVGLALTGLAVSRKRKPRN